MDAIDSTRVGGSPVSTASTSAAPTIQQGLIAGRVGLRSRPELVVIVYAGNLLFALVLSVPLLRTVRDIVDRSGFGNDLAARFDLIVWADILSVARESLVAQAGHLLWILPLYVIWKAALSVGLLHALQGNRTRPFLQGAGRFLLWSIVLGMVYLFLLCLGILAVLMLLGLIGSAWRSPVAILWIGIAAPVLSGLLVATLGLMRGVSRAALVIEKHNVLSALAIGLVWPFRHGVIVFIYAAWAIGACLAILLPLMLDGIVTAATTTSIVALFAAQQVSLLCRAVVTTGWFGSLAGWYETVSNRDDGSILVSACVTEASAKGTRDHDPGVLGPSRQRHQEPV